MKPAHSCEQTMRHSPGDIRPTILFGAQRVPLGACHREYSDTLLGRQFAQKFGEGERLRTIELLTSRTQEHHDAARDA